MSVNWFRGRISSHDGSSTIKTNPLSGETRGSALILHPFLIAAFPILSVYLHNVRELSPSVMIVPISLALLATALTWFVMTLVSRDFLRSGLITTLLVSLFFGYESLRVILEGVWNWLKSFWVLNVTQIQPLPFLILVGILVSLCTWFVFRCVHSPRVWNYYLNGFSTILVALPIIGIVSAKIGEPENPFRPHDLPKISQQVWTPDIYFIVLDGYARSDIMKELYDFDNKPFINRLEQRGFFVAKQSTSSYCQTQLSLASTLNCDYLQNLISPGTRELMPVETRLKKNLVQELLRPRGYKYVTFETGFAPTEDNRTDIYLSAGPSPSVFNQFLIAMTPLAPMAATLLPQARWTDYYSNTRDRTLFILDRLPDVARIPEPTFTFAHILSPHPPFIFDENGEDVSPRSITPAQRLVPNADPFVDSPGYVRNGYRRQSEYLTKRIDRVIDQILDRSPEPPVIILQSDHGSWLHYHHNDVEATDLRERFGTLNAILIPGQKIEGLTDDAKSVNTFRIVLNQIFGTKLPLLIPKSYFSSLNEPLKFFDVTDRLNSERERQRVFQPPKNYLGLMQQF